jgi:hypothetical protein
LQKKQEDEHELINIEASLQTHYESEGGGYTTQESKEELVTLEKAKKKLLEAKEANNV